MQDLLFCILLTSLPDIAMYMTQLLLPLWSNGGERFPHHLFEQVRDELVDKFGGLTAYTRTPASELWQENDGATVHDDIIVYEVMVKDLDEDWWSSYRKKLEQRFSQDKLVIRAQEIRLL
ncbi:hypothetical protein C8R21_1255 [Nitrosospira multiformis]|uniref:Uncharacterized protein n=1 Tax=Nitrosospira multiformis TaxID=1231 RepID=A0A2T5I6W8_9PROT|nr:hypothetical protein [Nitrosospira multiformis]PTQ79570.1 hypothetical protein C8R21_1255 [Nitrosospira multiformis]